MTEPTHTPSLVPAKPSRTRVAIAMFADVVPWFMVLLAMFVGEQGLSPSAGGMLGIDARERVVQIGAAVLLGGVGLGVLVLNGSLGPERATWGEWVAGLRMEGSAPGDAAMRWVGRLLKTTLVVFAPIRFLVTGFRADFVTGLLWFASAMFGLWVVIGLLRRERPTPGRPPSRELVDDADVFARDLSPERMVAWMVLLGAASNVADTYLGAALTPFREPVAYFVVTLARMPLTTFSTFATIGLLLAGRERTASLRRPVDMSEIGFVAGMILRPYWPVHAFRVAKQVLRAYPELNERTSAQHRPVRAFVVLTATTMALQGLLFVLREAVQQFDPVAWPESTGRWLGSAFAVLNSLALSVVLFRVREVRSRVSAPRGIESVAETFQ